MRHLIRCIFSVLNRNKGRQMSSDCGIILNNDETTGDEYHESFDST